MAHEVSLRNHTVNLLAGGNGRETIVCTRQLDCGPQHPACPAASNDPPKIAGGKFSPAVKRKILYVEDEAVLALAMRYWLEQHGYEVTSVMRGADALQAFRADPERFDLVITDQMMPGMSGTELAREISSIRPDIPIVFCTGCSDLASFEQMATVGVTEVVKKPIVEQKVVEIIRRLLP